MNVGKTLFAQIMDFLPWTTFMRYVQRYGGDRGVRTLPCAEQFRIMAFAQLTYRESLRDIEACLTAQASKLYHMGLRDPVRRSTLADANESRDWRIYADFAQRLIDQARRLYAHEDLGLELTNTVYALDSTTIDLCLSVFLWAHFRTTKAAVKMHTLLDLRGSIPSFIHVSDGKLHDLPATTICALYKSRWQVELFFKWIKQHLRIKRFFGTSENAVKTQIWIAVSVYVLVAVIKKRLDIDASLYTLLQILSVTLFEKMPLQQAFPGSDSSSNSITINNQLNPFAF